MEKEEILKVSEKLFYANKYTDIKLDNIANDLKIKKPSLYYYFKNKKDLFVQTLKYSANKYLNSLKQISQDFCIDDFIEWYLTYPSSEKNLFAISFQKWICSDDFIRNIVLHQKMNVYNIVNDYLKKLEINEPQIYLLINLLEKLSNDNCINWYCLPYDIQTLKYEIKKLFLS